MDINAIGCEFTNHILPSVENAIRERVKQYTDEQLMDIMEHETFRATNLIASLYVTEVWEEFRRRKNIVLRDDD